MYDQRPCLSCCRISHRLSVSRDAFETMSVRPCRSHIRPKCLYAGHLKVLQCLSNERFLVSKFSHEHDPYTTTMLEVQACAYGH